jgi:hypothetical protein
MRIRRLRMDIQVAPIPITARAIHHPICTTLLRPIIPTACPCPTTGTGIRIPTLRRDVPVPRLPRKRLARNPRPAPCPPLYWIEGLRRPLDRMILPSLPVQLQPRKLSPPFRLLP